MLAIRGERLWQGFDFKGLAKVVSGLGGSSSASWHGDLDVGHRLGVEVESIPVKDGKPKTIKELSAGEVNSMNHNSRAMNLEVAQLYFAGLEDSSIEKVSNLKEENEYLKNEIEMKDICLKSLNKESASVDLEIVNRDNVPYPLVPKLKQKVA
ncbi:hypothetical protein AgCh_013917 [Apium graveolens]